MGETLKLSPMTETIAKTIPFGRDNAMPRHVLSNVLGLNDRMMRHALQVAREEGVIILNQQDGRGYYQSSDLKELEAQYRQDTARAMSILKRRKALRDILKQMGGEV